MNIIDMVQSMLANGEVSQAELDAAINSYKQQYEANPTGVNKKIKLMEEATFTNLAQAQAENDIKVRIDNGEITAATFGSLSADEQNLAKLVLFKRYTPKHADVSRALSAIEFSLVFLCKVVNKAIDRTKLTTAEQSTLDSFANIFNLNDMPIDSTTDWRFQYLNDQFTQTQNNRAEYFTKKNDVTGGL